MLENESLIKVAPYLAGGFGVWLLLKKYFNGGTNYHYPSLKGKVVIITGANAGVGYESAREMATL